MRFLMLILVCVLFTACAQPTEQLLPEAPNDLQSYKLVVPTNVSENKSLETENRTQNLSINKGEERAPTKINKSEPILVNGAVDVTARIGAFKSRKILQEGEGLQVNNRTLIVVFIGEGKNGPQVLFQLNDETTTLSRKDDAYLEDAWLYVHEIYFRDRYEKT